MIKPHMEFEYIRADEVAECWDGVGKELYAVLWNVIVPHQKPIPNLEDSGPADHVGHENLAKYWHMLSSDEQTYLNSLAQKKEDEYKEWRAKQTWGDKS
jgi:hypothetical protein